MKKICAGSGISVLLVPIPNPCTLRGMKQQSSTLSRTAIDEFKEVYKRDYGEELSDQEASEMANRVLRYYAAISRLILSDEDKKGSNPVPFD